MARKARKKSESMFYHIIIKGISSQLIFEEEEDKIVFLGKIKCYQEKMGFELHGYCLMDNHVHLIIRDVEDEMEQLMKSFCISYAIYFNTKYDRSGPLFNDRYKSEEIEGDIYYKTVQRYIHQNPLKAGIEETDEYEWSSYKEFLEEKKNFVTTDYLLDMLGGKERFEEYMSEENQDSCLEVKSDRMTDKMAGKYITTIMKLESLAEIKKLNKVEKKELIKKCLEMNISERQLSRVTGISRGTIRKN